MEERGKKRQWKRGREEIRSVTSCPSKVRERGSSEGSGRQKGGKQDSGKVLQFQLSQDSNPDHCLRCDDTVETMSTSFYALCSLYRCSLFSRLFHFENFFVYSVCFLGKLRHRKSNGKWMLWWTQIGNGNEKWFPIGNESSDKGNRIGKAIFFFVRE